MKTAPMKQDRVLVVDDEAMVREVLHDILEQEGYDVFVAESAVVALKQARQQSFDLLLADIMLPEMSGLELVQRVRELSPGTVPILITGYPSLETVGAAIPQGVHSYIVKPVDKTELCQAVANALAARRLADGGSKRLSVLADVAPGEVAQCKKETTGTQITAPGVNDTLRNCELFETLSDHELLKVSSMCQEQTFGAGESIYLQGERAQKTYVIKDGCVALHRMVGVESTEWVAIDTAEQGAVIGWAALIEPRVHIASAVCLRGTKVVAIDGAELRCMLDKEPGAGFEVMKKLAVLLDNKLRAKYCALEDNSRPLRKALGTEFGIS